MNKNSRFRLDKKINKLVLRKVIFQVEDDDNNTVDFNDETMTLLCYQKKTKQMYEFEYKSTKKLKFYYFQLQKNTDRLIDYNTTKPQGTLDFNVAKSTESLSIDRPLSSDE